MKTRILNFKLLGILFFTISYLSSIAVYAKKDGTEIQLNKWLVSSSIKINTPAFAGEKNLKNKTFTSSDLLKFHYFDTDNFKYAKNGDQLSWLGQTISLKEDSFKSYKTSGTDKNLKLFITYINVDRFVNVTLNLKSDNIFEIYVDGENKGNKTSTKDSKFSKDLKLETGRHQILIKLLEDKKVNLEGFITYKEKDASQFFYNTANPKIHMDIDHLLNGKRIKRTLISPDGKFVLLSYSETFAPDGKNIRWSELRDVDNNNLLQKFNKDQFSFRWKPESHTLTFLQKGIKGNDFVSFDADNNIYNVIAKNLENTSYYKWSPKGNYIIYNVGIDYKSRKDGIKLYEGMPDRWPWWRSRSFLYKMDAISGISVPLTTGYKSTSLQDISPDGKTIIFSQNTPNYTARPYSDQVLFMMDMETYKLDTIWKKNFGGRASFSPDGESLLVIGGPSLFGKTGINVTDEKTPNEYDSQAYIYQLRDKRIEPITKNFNPKIVSAHWSKLDGNIYFLTEDKTYQRIYRYLNTTKSFEYVNAGMDIVTNVSFATDAAIASYTGNSISSPDMANTLDFDTDTYRTLTKPEASEFENMEFGSNEDWNFINDQGLTIEGRIYFPPNFDPKKKYPVIVYYYGGTSPTTRNFRGRYPKNLFAANGYIVYNLQPSGATGYGQNYSAIHVNGWGKENAQDIIKGTKEFLKTHPYADSKRVGCIGASYGGYMTMFLTTQTNIFSAAISHAGISSISSYWGEGYWGYLYSSTASANSFPWNNKKLYVEQSPLFNADKVNTPLLLLHGNSDTNVPPGESQQFYTALKLLGKTVELIEIDKQDHHIIDYKKRILWQKTIIAWFDKYLKGQNDWWKDLYPDRSL
ncbi:MAG: prolyl oligopeptidase family serine peptidase [Hyphomicrobiales bacterium]